MDKLTLICSIIFALIIMPPIIWGIAVRVIVKLRLIKKIKIRVGNKTGIIDLESEELIVRQIERIKKGKK